MSNPTTAVFPLASTLDGQSQTGALALTGVDPIRYDDGLWLEQAGTNIWVNPRAATNVDGTNTDLGAQGSRSRDDTVGYIGGTSFKVERTSAGSNGQNLISGFLDAAPSQAYAMSCAVRVTSGAAYCRPVIATFDAGFGFIGFALGTSFALTGAFVEHAQVLTLPATGTIARMILTWQFWADAGASVHTANGTVVHITNIQAELGSYATSIIDSSLGAGYTALTRDASSASVPTAGIISPVAGSFNVQEFTRLTDTGSEEFYGRSGTVGSGTDALRWGVTSSDEFFVEWNSNNAGWERTVTLDTIDVDTPYRIEFDWDDTDVSIRIDGGSAVTGTRDTPENDWGAGDLILEAA